jgi:hypothetical protein
VSVWRQNFQKIIDEALEEYKRRYRPGLAISLLNAKEIQHIMSKRHAYRDIDCETMKPDFRLMNVSQGHFKGSPPSRQTS